MKTYLKIFGITLLIILISILVLFASGYLNVAYKNIIGTATESANRNIYKENKSYVEGSIADLSSYKMQYETSTSETEKQAIKTRIINDFSNFDINKIQSYNLKQFLIEMRGF